MDEGARGSGAGRDGRETLTASGVTQTYGDLEVLDDLSTKLYEGEVCAVAGANGSGKTTLLKILAGLLTPDEGTVDVEPDVDGAREIGYLPQRPSFRRGFTVLETLELHLDLLPGFQPEEGYVEELLRDVEMWTARDRGVRELSGGMTRLVGMAVARIGDPAVVLLDEPTSGLDPEMTRRTFEAVRRLVEDGTSAFLTTHDLEAVERHGDRVLYLGDGRVLEDGSPEELLGRYDVGSLTEIYDEIATSKPSTGGGEGP